MKTLPTRIRPVEIFAALATCFTFSAVSPSQAAVIDFESLEHVDEETVNHGTEYEEDGFRLTTPVGNLISNGTLKTYFSGSTAIYNGFQDGRQRIVSIDEAPFDLVSIDLTELNPFPPPGPTVLFTGELASGGTVMQSFTLDGVVPEPETFVFDPSFQDLVAVEFMSSGPTNLPGDQAFQYDNITLSAPAIIIDDEDPGFTLIGSDWISVIAGSIPAYDGDWYRSPFPPVGSETASWEFSGLSTGVYEVSITWFSYPTSSSSAAPYAVYDGATLILETTLDQSVNPEPDHLEVDIQDNDIPFEVLGNFSVTTGTLEVELGMPTSGLVTADAVRIEAVPEPSLALLQASALVLVAALTLRRGAQ